MGEKYKGYYVKFVLKSDQTAEAVVLAISKLKPDGGPSPLQILFFSKTFYPSISNPELPKRNFEPCTKRIDKHENSRKPFTRVPGLSASRS